MTRKEVKALQAEYGLAITRNPVTREAWGLTIDAADLIPALDALADGDPAAALPCAVTRENLYGIYRYTVACPTAWFDLWGWADE